MACRICCYTLFNINQTGVLNRGKIPDNYPLEWINKRNTQCNFDTILQVISLRAQPDIITSPIKIDTDEHLMSKFGYVYINLNQCWKFEFEVQHESVFENGISEFGALYNDCSGVPMIIVDEINLLPSFLDTSDETRNIYFEGINDNST